MSVYSLRICLLSTWFSSLLPLLLFLYVVTMLRFPVPQRTDYLLNCVCVKFNWSFTFSFFVFFATSLRVRVCMACECLCVYFEFTINKLLLLLFFLLQIYYYFVCCVCTWLTLLLMFVHCLLDGCYFSLSLLIPVCFLFDDFTQ